MPNFAPLLTTTSILRVEIGYCALRNEGSATPDPVESWEATKKDGHPQIMDILDCAIAFMHLCFVYMANFRAGEEL